MLMFWAGFPWIHKFADERLMMQNQSVSIDGAPGVFCHAQFALIDLVRRAQGDALGAFGLNPGECSYSVIESAAHWRLRDYGGSSIHGPCFLIVAAPIKRPYVWDIAPSTSALRHCLEQGLHVYLLEWTPTGSATASKGIEEHAEAVSVCVAKISDWNAGATPFLIGHSLGGTLAAVYGALSPGSIRGLVLLSAPLCFQPGMSGFRDALASLASKLSDADSFPGSLLSHVSALASPGAFVWSTLKDAALSLSDPLAMEIHSRVERWALDEVAVSGQLFREITTWLYHENRFFCGSLKVSGRLIGPSSLSAPTLAVVNADDDVAPLASIKPFIDAMPIKDTRIIEYPRETGVCLQHVGILVGREARRRVWPEIVSWLRSHRRTMAFVR
jgi:polyhydroxyalkanoate synthase subunit PhaC